MGRRIACAVGFGLLLLLAARPVWPQASAPPAAATDPLRGRLDAAKAAYTADTAKLKAQLQADLEKKLAAARRNGDKAQVDRVKSDIDKFGASGVLPTTVPTAAYEKGMDRARDRIAAAYQQVIKEHTKAARDDQAAAAEKELTEFLRPAGAFVSLFNGKDLTGWKTTGGATWRVTGGAVESPGAAGGWLVTERTDYADVHVRCEAKIGEGSNSGLAVRANPADPGRLSYEASINATHRDPNRTGSIYTYSGCVVKVPKATHAVDRWFTLEVIVVGTRVVARVDGEQVAEFTDPEKRYAKGAIALQQLGGGGAGVAFRKVEVRELTP